MKSSPNYNQKGIAHLGLILAGVVVLGVIGFAGFKVFSGKKATDNNIISRAALEAACTESDKNICKFQAGWKTHKYYTVKMKTTGGETAYETITIDNTMYTKAPNGVWWQQTLKSEENTSKLDFTFDDSSDDSEKKDAPKTTYKNLGTETCGDLTCHKYQVLTEGSEDIEYIWFDTEDYQLRKTRTESKDGSVTEGTFSYDKISITAPSPVKELGPNQYLVPGQNEPQILPDGASGTVPSGGDISAGTADEPAYDEPAPDETFSE